MVVLTVRAVNVAIGAVVMFMGVIVATTGTVDVGLGHAEYSRGGERRRLSPKPSSQIGRAHV